MHKELSKQSKIIDEAEKYQKERDKILADNEELHNTVNTLEHEYKLKTNNLDFDFRNIKRKLEEEFEEKIYNLEYEYKGKNRKLEKENSHLHKIIDKFYFAIDTFIEWVCQKFSLGDSKELIENFEKDTNISLDPKQQIKKEEIEKEWDLDLEM